MRLDAYLVGRGFAPSRDKAKVLIDQGLVYVEGSNRVKASLAVGPGTHIEVREPEA